MEGRSPFSDAELLEKFNRTRDGSAFGEIVRRHHRMVMGVCRRVVEDPHATEDAFQSVFLILARKADSIRKTESLAGWLYNVAVHTSLQAKRATLLRRLREAHAGARIPTVAPDGQEMREFVFVLDEELRSLPERYRLPVILCYLEEETNELAANKLGLPVGSISKLLARGKDMLRDRLVERGVTISGAALAAFLAGEAAAATVSPALAASTVQAAATGSLGVVPPVQLLVQQGLNALLAAKLKVAAVVLVAASVVGTTGLVFQEYSQGSSPSPEKAPAVAKAALTGNGPDDARDHIPNRVIELPRVVEISAPRPSSTGRGPGKPFLIPGRARGGKVARGKPTPGRLRKAAAAPSYPNRGGDPPGQAVRSLPGLPTDGFDRAAALKGALKRSAGALGRKETSGSRGRGNDALQAAKKRAHPAGHIGPQNAAKGLARANEASQGASQAAAKGQANAQAAVQAARNAARKASKKGE